MLIEFYSADPQEMVELFSSLEEDDMTFFDHLEAYPVADFSLHLLLPDDLDHLCQALRKYDASLPPTFRAFLIKQCWVDSSEAPSESLTLLADTFAQALVSLSEAERENVAQDWTATFPDPSAEVLANASKALLSLQEVARHALLQKKALLLRLMGHAGF